MTWGSLDARALALLDDALEQLSAEREAWITRRCGDDDALRDRTLSLLRAGSSGGGHLQTGAGPLAFTRTEMPERIGAYRITGLIGQGGMGAVYRGERAAGDFDHVAAIKLIRPGALSDTLVERFQRERQTLASLSHPHIARLFDGGETADGDPYIVMEYVDGRPLGMWLAETDAGRDARIRLFLEICAAVGFAHQNLIVHRDITSSNVLVTKDGGAKLIDFGIARPPAQPDASAQSPRKSLEGLSLTPGFAAPERLAGAPATTLSDIYSLGVLLERMLGGAMDTDLGAIIARATATEPADRYPSADALAEDVRAWRDGLPVAARDGGRGYVLARFVRRHRVGVSSAAAALALLLVALGFSSWSYRQAEKAREAEARRFEEVRSLASYMLFDLNDQLLRVPGNTVARSSLASEAQRYLSSLAATPGASRALRMETARGLIRLARIQGTPAQPTLGDRPAAKRSLAEAERQIAGVVAEHGAAADTAAALARIHADLSLIAVTGDKDPEEADRLHRKAVAALDAVPGAERGWDWHDARRTVLRARLEWTDQQDEAAEMARLAERLEADIAEWPAGRRETAEARMDRASAAYYRGLGPSRKQEGDHGVAQFRTAVDRFRALERDLPNDPLLLYRLAWAGLDGFAAAAQTGRDALSAELLTIAQDAAARLIAVEDKDDSVVTLAYVVGESWSQHLANTGRYAESIAAQRAVIEREKARSARDGGSTGVNVAFSEMILGVNARKGGDRATACEAWTSAERRFSRIEATGRLVEFHAAFLPGLRRNVALCAQGAPLSAFGPLR